MRPAWFFSDSHATRQVSAQGYAMKIRPILDSVLVKLDPGEKVTRGGIFIPEDAQKLSRWGEVLAVGTGHYERGIRLRENEVFTEEDMRKPPFCIRPLEVKPGDRVLCSIHACLPVPDSQDEFIIQERAILAVCEEP